MIKKLKKNDGIKLFGFGVTLIAGLWALWTTNMEGSNLVLHIKFIYSLFLTLSIVISAYYIIFKINNTWAKAQGIHDKNVNS